MPPNKEKSIKLCVLKMNTKLNANDDVLLCDWVNLN